MGKSANQIPKYCGESNKPDAIHHKIRLEGCNKIQEWNT